MRILCDIIILFTAPPHDKIALSDIKNIILEDYILGEILQTENKKQNSFSLKMLILCAIFTALTAVGAFIRIPLPLIPFTLQFPIIALSAVLLGGKYAMLSQLAYLLIGLIGFPIFTKGGGLGYIFEPTFGFLIGFVIAAFIIGKIIEKRNKPTVIWVFFACAVGILVDYAIGVTYMYFILNYYIKATTSFLGALWSGAIVFLPKDLIICIAIAFLSTKLLPALKKAKLLD